MKRLILLLALINISINVCAQFSYPIQKNAQEFLNRTLIVELEEIDKKHVAKLKKKGKTQEMKNYIKNIEGYNQLLKKYFQKYWTMTPVEFKTESEVDEIVKSKNKNYSIFSTGWRAEKRKQGIDVFLEFEVYSITTYLAEKGNRRNKYYIDNQGSTTLARGPHIFKVSLASRPISETDYKFILEQFQIHTLKAVKIGKTSALMKGAYYVPKIEPELINLLKKKKLSIPKEYIDFGENDIKEVYKYPFEITTIEKEEKLILGKNEKYAYINYVWSDKQQYFAFVVVDIESGNILARIGIGGVSISVYGISNELGKYSPIISYRSKISFSKKHLKTINRFID